MVGLSAQLRLLISSPTLKLCKRYLRSLRDLTGTTQPKKPLRVLYFGSDDFAIPTLKMLHNRRRCGDLEELAVVCVRLRRGRTATRAYAETHQLPVLDWPLQLTPGHFHLALVASFGHLLPKKLIDMFPMGVLNVHGSLLPRWRGAAPVVHAIRAGDTVTGVTIMTVKPHKFDVGEIVAREEVPIAPTEDVHGLTARLAETGAELLERCLDRLPAALAAARPQPELGTTLAPRLTAEDYRVRWRDSAGALLRQSRAMPAPLLTSLHGRRVRLPRLLPEPDPPSDSSLHVPALVVRRGAELSVACGDGWVRVQKLQMQGKRMMTGVEFHNGYLHAIPETERRFDVS